MGLRRKEDPSNIEGSGMNYYDRVSVEHEGDELSGIVEAVHAGGKRVDVRITHAGSKHHNRVITFATDSVERLGEPIQNPGKPVETTTQEKLSDLSDLDLKKKETDEKASAEN